MGERDGLRIRYFLLSFSAAFFVLSLMFLFLMSTVHPKTSELAAAEVREVGEPYQPVAEDALTVLFYGIERDDAVAGTYLLARFAPAHGKVYIAVFPSMTEIETPSGTQTLEEAYRVGGASYTRTALASTLGVDIDRYVRVNQTAFVQVAATVGSVEFELPEPLEVDGMTLEAGMQLLDGRRAAELIRRRDYEGGEQARCELVARLAAEIVNQRIDTALSTVVDRVFEQVINLVDTDIDYTDYESRKQAAAWLAEQASPVAEVIPVTGSFSPDGNLFILRDTVLAQLRGRFSG